MMRLFCFLFFVSVYQAMATNQMQPIKAIEKDAIIKRLQTPYEATDASTTTGTTPVDYLVTVRTSNVPSLDYEYDAVGILQVLLDETRNMTTVLPQFLKEFQLKHDSHQWKLSHACSTLLLPNSVVYMELYEHATGTTIYLFE
ncbi:uncharacterized protein LOC143192747 isoform X1 [Rhynchophorus ferrugineus]|uniref:uncharacterized protein LOC143192747 isoform X1 n=1 Tax=Rhynchophorus ferrugineus TaxID=354439 RepID=UPI003FCC8B26